MVRQISGTLTITIKKQDENYTIEAKGPKGIKVDPQPAPQLKDLLSNQQITDTLKDLSSQTAPATTDAIQKLGKALYDSLFTDRDLLLAFGKVQGSTSSDSGARLRLQIEPIELAVLPWETLHDGKDWLSAQSTTPLVRKLTLSNNRKPLQKLQVRGALRILFVGASPENLDPLKVEETADELETLLGGAIKKKQIVFDKLLNATLEDLQQGLLKDYHILYFAGHGSPEGIFLDDGQGDVIEKEGKVIGRERGDKSLVSAETLAQALKGKQTRLVFLAACETSKASEGSRLLRGFAQELAERSNLPAIVAMQYFISDMQANPLTTQFFAALAAGRPVDVAMAEARSVLMKKGQVNRDVFSPVLYLQAEDGALFPKAKNWPVIGLGTALLIAALVGGTFARSAAINQVKNYQQQSEAALSNRKDLEALIEIVRAGKSLKTNSLLVLFKPDSELQAQVLQTFRRVFYIGKENNQLQQDQNVISVLGSDGKQLQIDSQLQKLINDKEQVYDFVVSPDDNQIATREKDGIIRVWNLQGQQLQQLNLKELQDGGESHPDLQFNPDGNQLAIMVDDKNYHTTALLWDWKNNQAEEFQWSKDNVAGFGFKSDGTPLVATRVQDQDASVWDWSGNELASFNTSGYGSFFSVIFSPSGKQALIASGEDSCAPFWWNWLNNQENSEPESMTVSEGFDEKFEGFGCEASFSTDGKKVAVGGRDGMVRVWEVSEYGGLGNKKEFKGHEGNVNKVTFSSDGKQLISIGEDGTIRSWNLERSDSENFPSYLATLERHQDQVTTLDFTPDGKQIITAGNDDTVRLWNLSDQSLASSFSISQGGVIEILFSPDGKQFATAGKNKTIQLWDLSGKPQLTEPFKIPKGDFISMIFNPKDGKLLVMTKEGDGDILSKTYVWDLSTDKPLQIFDVRPAKGFLVSPQGQVLVATVARDDEGELAQVGRLFLLDLTSRNEYKTLDACSDGKVKFSNDGSLLALAKNDGTVKLCDIQSGKELTEFNAHPDINEGKDSLSLSTEGENPSIESISFSRDSNLLATVGADGTIKLWQVGGLDKLLNWGCQRLHDYLKNPNVSESDKNLCN